MNTFGTIFRISIFGESHGESVGVVIDGCPAGIPLKHSDFQADFARRRSGAKGTTPRRESDIPSIMSGVFNELTTGAPVMIMFENSNTRSGDYTKLTETPRPGHADLAGGLKFGHRDLRNVLERASARETAARTAAGALCRIFLSAFDIDIASHVVAIGRRSQPVDRRPIEGSDRAAGEGAYRHGGELGWVRRWSGCTMSMAMTIMLPRMIF